MKLILIAITSLALIGCGPNNIIQRTFNGPDPLLLRVIIEVIPLVLLAALGQMLIRPKKHAEMTYFNKFRFLASWLWFLSVFSAQNASSGDSNLNPKLLFYVFRSAEFWAHLAAVNIGLSPITLILAIWFPKKKSPIDISPQTTSESKNNLNKELSPKTNLDDFKYYEIASNEFDSGKTNKGILAKAKVEAMGDSSKVEAIYIKIRAQVLSAQESDNLDANKKHKKRKEVQGDSGNITFKKLDFLEGNIQKKLRKEGNIKLIITSFEALQRHSKAIHKVGFTLYVQPRNCSFTEDGKNAEYISMGIKYICKVAI